MDKITGPDPAFMTAESTANGSTGESTAAKLPPPPALPEAQALLEKAQELWAGGTCVNPQQALDYLDEALSLDENYAEALLWRGKTLSAQGYHADAFDDITRSIVLYPVPLAYAERGLVNMRLNQLVASRRDLNYAQHKNSALPHTYAYRAALNFLEDQKSAGCADLKKACQYGQCAPLEAARKEGLCS